MSRVPFGDDSLVARDEARLRARTSHAPARDESSLALGAFAFRQRVRNRSSISDVSSLADLPPVAGLRGAARRAVLVTMEQWSELPTADGAVRFWSGLGPGIPEKASASMGAGLPMRRLLRAFAECAGSNRALIAGHRLDARAGLSSSLRGRRDSRLRRRHLREGLRRLVRAEEPIEVVVKVHSALANRSRCLGIDAALRFLTAWRK